MFFDTHFHLNDSQYKEMNRDELIKNAYAEGLEGFINISAKLGESRTVVEQVLKINNAYAAIGIHPSRVGKAKDSDYEELRMLLIEYPKKIKAIGECGLDFYYKDNPKREVQINNFKKHIELAIEFNKSLVIHSRSAFKETVDIIEQHPGLRIIIHCFTYNKEQMEKFVELGCYISFSGIITFNKAEDIQEAAKFVPIDKILCETDAPLLTPIPYRGKTNFPQMVKFVYKKLNELRNEKIEEQVMKNVKKAFDL